MSTDLLSFALGGKAIITSNTTPTLGDINSYDTTVFGAMSVTLPTLVGQNEGALALLEKAISDTTYNKITFNTTGGQTFQDGSTSVNITQPGEQVLVQAIEVSSVLYWKIIQRSTKKIGLKSRTTQLALNTSNTATDIITAETLNANQLAAGSTFELEFLGTVKVKAGSGTLTFTPYIQGVNLNTIQMTTKGSAEGPVGFYLKIKITVRTTGATGTAIAHGFGWIKFATNTAEMLTSTNTSTTTIDTTAAADIGCKATWQTSDANNDLRVEIGTIKREL